MTPLEAMALTLWIGFGIRAGWFLCDTLIEAVPAVFDWIERRQYRKALAEPDTVTIVNTAEHAPADGGVIGEMVRDARRRGMFR